MFKKLILTVLLVLLMVPSVSAQFLGQMASARAKATASGALDAYLVLADGATGVVGSVRYGLAPFIELRGRMGYLDPDYGDGSVIVGGDFKYQLWEFGRDLPCDLSFGAATVYTKLNEVSLFSLGGNVTASIPFEAGTAASIEPYATFHLRYQRLGYKGDSDTSLEAALSLGGVFSFSRLTDFTAEILIDDDTAFLIGFTFLKF